MACAIHVCAGCGTGWCEDCTGYGACGHGKAYCDECAPGDACCPEGLAEHRQELADDDRRAGL